MRANECVSDGEFASLEQSVHKLLESHSIRCPATSEQLILAGAAQGSCGYWQCFHESPRSFGASRSQAQMRGP